MPRYFEFKDDKSSKFWEIELQDNSFTVRYGKIGAAGQTQTKEFANEAAAEKEYNKLVDEKVKKGYTEIGSGAAPVDKPPVQKSLQTTSPQKKPDAVDKTGAKTTSAAAPTQIKTESREDVRRFEFEDDKSSKFWEISLDGSSFTVCYGRIGTDGQTQTKDFDSEAKAEKEYEKLVQEKLKKGYEEVEEEEEEEDDDEDDESDVEGEDTFAGLDIEEWDREVGIFHPQECAFRVGLTYEEDDEEGLKWADKFAAFLDDPKAAELRALVVGSWGSQIMSEGEASGAIVEALVAARERLPNLKALFMADVDSEECEISWIQQSDMSPLFDAYPNLTHFRVRGGVDLELGTLKHNKLQSLVLESGGLSTEVVRSVAGAQLPELLHLELWLGTDNYGGNYTIDDLRPILDGKVFPKLKYLGLRNSEMTDRIALALNDAPILKRIRVLDLSMGTLGDKGATALLNNPSISKLEKVCVGHHYMTPGVVESMERLGNVHGLEELEDANTYHDEDDLENSDRYCQVSE